jgi:hypothetical protein
MEDHALEKLVSLTLASEDFELFVDVEFFRRVLNKLGRRFRGGYSE